MKKVRIINQNKGGVGKSFLSALILAKEVKRETNVIIIDVDSGNRSTIKRFSSSEIYGNYVSEHSLLRADVIDKGMFTTFFEEIASSPRDVVYLDLGGNESREILSLFGILGVENVVEFMKDSDIELEFFTVLKADDKDSLDHFINVSNLIMGHFPHTCFVNSLSFNDEKSIAPIVKAAKLAKAEVRSFGKTPSGQIEEKMSNYVKSGLALSLGMSKGVFIGMLENLNID